MKNILKTIVDGLFGYPEISKNLEQEPRQPIIVEPQISEEEQQKIETSKKLLDIVLKDLEKYPPSEWNSNPHVWGLYEHKCLLYSIWTSKPEAYISHYDFDALTRNDAKRLYQSFFIEYEKARETKRLEILKHKVEEFLDDSKRIICKENE